MKFPRINSKNKELIRKDFEKSLNFKKVDINVLVEDVLSEMLMKRINFECFNPLKYNLKKEDEVLNNNSVAEDFEKKSPEDIKIVNKNFDEKMTKLISILEKNTTLLNFISKCKIVKLLDSKLCIFLFGLFSRDLSKCL